MEKILVVEDEKPILTGIKDMLEMEGFEVITAKDGKRGLELAREKMPDLIILDIMLPKMNGFEVCKKLRKEKNPARIIILSAKKEETDKVRGLDLGADDYVTKPFGVNEFLARVKAVLRRPVDSVPDLKTYSFGDVRVDFERMEAVRGKEKIELTTREFKILRVFIENRGKVVTREDLLKEVWGYEVAPTTRTVDNHIVKLRKAIEDDPADPKYIISMRSLGYKFMG
ncbi:MAG: response regulator transcription factor [Planctomycetota bacterium]|jgi:DNA-binding response OmpR family regulator